MTDNKINVMIVDDSLSIRMFLQSIIAEAPDMAVMAQAKDPLEAMEILKTKTPDVITLDVEMPHMDGITFLDKLMKLKPLPVVMFSTLTTSGSATAMKALEKGAVEITSKPSTNINEIKTCTEEILLKIRQASRSQVGQVSKHKEAILNTNTPTEIKGITQRVNIDDVVPLNPESSGNNPHFWFIGSSTGGPVALKDTLDGIEDPNTPPILVAQHISSGFGAGLIRWLNQAISLNVVEAQEAMKLEKGHVYIPASGQHLMIAKGINGDYVCKMPEMTRVNRHKPSVDVLMRSAVNVIGKNARAAILTGMGDDGAVGLSDLKNGGARTFIQERSSCVVDGMPRSARELNPRHEELSLTEINNLIKGDKKW